MNFKKMLMAIDAHTEGNPERVVTGGIPPIPGKTMLEKSKYVRDNLDHLRTLLVYEPRGHSNMYASLVVPHDMILFTCSVDISSPTLSADKMA